jgi:hypothetical protein
MIFNTPTSGSLIHAMFNVELLTASVICMNIAVITTGPPQTVKTSLTRPLYKIIPDRSTMFRSFA